MRVGSYYVVLDDEGWFVLDKQGQEVEGPFSTLDAAYGWADENSE